MRQEHTREEKRRRNVMEVAPKIVVVVGGEDRKYRGRLGNQSRVEGGGVGQPYQ